jgi:hypothetical protein
VQQIQHTGSGLTLWLGPDDDAGATLLSAQFATVPPTLKTLTLGEQVGYLVDGNDEAVSITVHGVTVTAATSSGRSVQTLTGQQTADRSALIGALCLLVLLGLWAACQRWSRLRPARWVLPTLAGVWFAGTLGFWLNQGDTPRLTFDQVALLGGLCILSATLIYAAVVGFKALGRSAGFRPSAP